MTRLRIGLVQYDPAFRRHKRNVQHVDAMIATLQPGDVDILLLPEMTFTGYMFSNLEEIEPHLEIKDGASVKWAQQTAAHLRCYTLVGFPERCIESGKLYNALAVVDWHGQVQVSLGYIRNCSLAQSATVHLQKALSLRDRQNLGGRRRPIRKLPAHIA